MVTIIGIDPGSQKTGFGVIQVKGNQNFYIASGCLSLVEKTPAERLQKIFRELQQVVQTFQPHEAAIEQIFMHQNPGSALKLGQARGAAIVALGLPVAEYSARQVKQSVVGFGAAKKNQVQHMVQKLLNLSKKFQADEADALAVALCHAHARLCRVKFGESFQKKSKSWRSYVVPTGNQ